MSNSRNSDTKEALSRELKVIQTRCRDTCNIIENAPLDANISNTSTVEKALCYVEGLRSVLQNSNTPVTSDNNLLTSQFLAEMKEKTKQVDELIAFTKGSILDLDVEIKRLTELTRTAQEARSKPRAQKRAVRPEHIMKAKEHFQKLKTELHGLIQSLFPNASDLITDVFGQLMQEKLNDGSSGYIPITQENYDIIELLKDFNIVTTNPYNNTEVKIAY